MNLPHKKAIKKPIIITVAAIALIAMALCMYVYLFNGTIFGWSNKSVAKVNDVNYSNPTKEQSDAGKQIEQNNSSDDPNQVGSDRAPQPSSADGNKANTPVTITASGQNGNIVQIRTLISAITNTGTCTLTLTKQGQTITKTSAVQSMPSSATCQGFDVPVNELNPGIWQIAITFNNDTMTGTANGSVSVQQVIQ